MSPRLVQALQDLEIEDDENTLEETDILALALEVLEAWKADPEHVGPLDPAML